MRALKVSLLVLISFAGIGVFEKKAEAGTSFHVGVGYHRPAYRHYGYRPYYRPYWGYYGFGYGYPYYSYGYAYPYGSYYYGFGEVRTEIKPDEARVYLDGDYVGVADDFNSWWQRLNVEPGKHRLVFRAQGYQPYTVTMRVLPGRDYHVKQQLQPGDDAIPESEMRIPRDERDQQYSSRDRNYDNERRDERYQRDDRYDRDESDRDDDRYDSDRLQGEFDQDQSGKTMMTFQVEPDDATIYIDGDYYGTADSQDNNQIQVLLPDGTHRIEVVRPGYETFSKDIVVNESATRNITIQLDKK